MTPSSMNTTNPEYPAILTNIAHSLMKSYQLLSSMITDTPRSLRASLFRMYSALNHLSAGLSSSSVVSDHQ